MNSINLKTRTSAQDVKFYNEEAKEAMKSMQKSTQSFKGTNSAEQDKVEINKEDKKEKKENALFRLMREFGADDPKKTLKSIVFTIGTIFGLAFIGNKFAHPLAEAGIKFEEKFLKDGSLYSKAANAFNKAKNGIANFFKTNKLTSGFANDVADTFKNRKAAPICNFARGTGQGPKTIFAITPVETLKNALITNKNSKLVKELTSALGDSKAVDNVMDMLADGKSTSEVLSTLQKAADPNLTKVIDTLGANTQSSMKSLGKLVGDANAQGYYKELLKKSPKSNIEFCREFIQAIQKQQGFDPKDKKALLDFFKDLSEKQEYGTFQKVDMLDGGMTGSWWPVNIYNNFVEKIGLTKKYPKLTTMTKGDLGDALMKFNVVDGKMTNTKVGALIAGGALVTTESISNFVNDKSGLGAFLGKNIVDSYDNIQDAPKGKKLSTAANDFLGSAASWVIATPLAFKATYGLATLARLEGNNPVSKVVKNLCKVFDMGLNEVPLDKSAGILKRITNQLKRKGGGTLRLVLVIFVFASLFRKPIDAVMHKIFGKPYSKNEEEKQKAQEAAKNQVIPELGITQGELIEKINNNPEALKKAQNDPELTKKLQENPKLLLDLLDGKDISKAPQTQKRQGLSEANMNFIKRQQNSSKLGNTSQLENNPSQVNLFSKPKNDKKEETTSKDTATYIPSSQFKAKTSSISPELEGELGKMNAKTEKLLKKAEQFI